MTKVFKDGKRYVETEDGLYRVALSKIKGNAMTLMEMCDEHPVAEIYVFPDEIDDFINMWLEVKSEYRKEFGYE